MEKPNLKYFLSSSHDIKRRFCNFLTPWGKKSWTIRKSLGQMAWTRIFNQLY